MNSHLKSLKASQPFIYMLQSNNLTHMFPVLVLSRVWLQHLRRPRQIWDLKRPRLFIPACEMVKTSAQVTA